LKNADPATFDILVVGGGPAGVTAALRARELGAERVALVERGERLGGVCTNDGCVPTRVLARAARLLRDAGQWGDFGVTGGGAPPRIDIACLMAHVRETVDRVHAKKGLPGHLEEAGVSVYAGAGAARLVDPHTVELPDRGGERLRAEKIILCPGGHARRPPFPGAELAVTHSGLWDLDRLPGSLLVVGAAATGCQIASVMAAFGVPEVTLVEMAPRVLTGEDPVVSEAVAAGLSAQGVNVLTGVAGGVARIDALPDGRRRVALKRDREEDGEPEHVEAELVVLCVGWPGNVEGLGLEAAGVQVERGYVKVDDTLLCAGTSHVWAAGDLTGRMMLVQSALDEGRIAAENAVTGAGRADSHTVVPHGGFTDPEYASVGPTEERARTAEPECIAVTVPYADLDRAVIDGRTAGAFKLLVSRASGAVLGAHVAGEQALEVIHLIAGAMAAGAPVEALADLELAYPTYSAVVGLAARQACRELGRVALAETGRDLLARRPRAAEWERNCRPYNG
jgi:pyruvate/2-oxoglutarate dehydrogenase complex dihydrolipoamide dehydrogenase (E3) component